MNIAFFDFDGTITTKDTLIEFIKYAVGLPRFICGFIALLPMLVLFKLKLIPNYKAKQMMISYFFKGWSIEKFTIKAQGFSSNMIDPIVRDGALKRLQWHKDQGDEIVVVSASMECWLKPWCEKYDLKLISTKLELENGVVTGKFLTKNCHGQEKVNRIKEKYDLNQYDKIYVYGDSSGDTQMLELGDEKFYKYY